MKTIEQQVLFLDLNTVSQMVQDCDDGIESPFKAYAMIKELHDELGKALDYVKQIAIAESQYEESTFEKDGIKFEKRAGAKRYSFKGIDEWEAAKSTLQDIESKYKGAWSATQKGIQAVSADGELMQLPTVTYSKDTLIIKK